MDLIYSDTGRELYLVLRKFEAATDFDPYEEDTEGMVLRKLGGTSRIADLAAYISGSTPEDTESPIFQYPFQRQGIITGVGYVFARVAPIFDAIYTLSKNGTPFGTMTVLAGQNVGSFEISSQIFMEAGDLFTISQAAEQTEGTESVEWRPVDLSFTLRGVRN